jgi:fibronectin type 3 domain-containing protein
MKALTISHQSGKRTNIPRLTRWVGLTCFALGILPSLAAAQATQFKFTGVCSPAGLYYVVGSNSVTFQVQALDSSNAIVTGFHDNVTAGLYNTATSQLSDPKAIFTSGGTTYIGTAPLSFVNGVANFGITLQAGSNSEQVVLLDTSAIPVTVGTTYPGSLGVTTGLAITVEGYMSAPLFPRDLYFNGLTTNPPTDDTPIGYTVGGTTDIISTKDSSVTAFGLDYGDSVPQAGGVTGTSGFDTTASCYVTQGFNGGFSAANAGVSVNLWFISATANNSVTYQIILDYDGSLTDYNNPVSAEDTVLQGTVNSTTYYTSNVQPPTLVPGFQPYQPFMLSGAKVIFRVWTGVGDSVTMKYTNGTATPDDTSVSYIRIPYSSLNVLPLRSIVTAPSYTAIPSSPPYVLSGASPITIIDTFQNQYSNALTQIVFQIPADPLGAQNWTIASIPAPTGPNPGASTAFSQPSGTTSGSVTLNFNSSFPVTMNEFLPVTIIGQSPATNYSWPLSILSAIDVSGSLAPFDSAGALVYTLGIPSQPSGFAVSPANYNSGGDAVSLNWGQVTDQSSLGYILNRVPTSSAFPMTLFGTGSTSYTDSAVTNLVGYDYTVAAYNAVTQSSQAAVGPVTSFANPAVPTNVQALSAATSVLVSWTEPASVSGSYPVAGYQVYRSASSGGEGGSPLTTVLGGATSITDNGLTPATQYYYKVSAIDSQYASGAPGGAHDSALSSTEGNGYPPGNPPTGLGYNLLNTAPATIQVYWTAPTGNLNNPVSYLINREPNGTGGFTPLTVIGAASTTLNDALVTIGTFYTYEVAGIDALGVTTNPSGSLNAYILPSAPTGLTASPSLPASGNVTLTWNAVTGEGTILNYKLYRDGTLVASPVANGPVTDTPSFGVTHVYTVSAVNNGGEGSLSAPVTTAILPNTPAGLSLGVSTTVRTDVLLTWATPVPAEQDLTQYNIYRGTSAIFGSASPLALDLTLPVTAYTDSSPTTAAAGTTYYYFLQAQNMAGTGTPAVQSLKMPPNPPTGLGATSSASAVSLTWTANPGGEGVTAYQVIRDSTPVAFVAGASVSFYTDLSGVTAGVNHIYTLVAWNTGGYSLTSGPVTVALLPAAPSGLSVLAVGAALNNVQVLWSASGAATNLTGYNLYRNTTPVTTGMSPVSINITPAAAGSPITDTTSFSAGATLYYFLQGVNISGSGPLTMLGLQLPLQAPGSVGSISTSTDINLGWSNSVPSAGSVSFYTVYRGTSPAAITQVLGTVSGQTSYDDLTASPGVDYYYQITDTDPGGPSAPGWESLRSTSVTMGLKPQIPTLGTITLDTSNDVTFSWNPVTIVDPNAEGVSVYVNGSGVTALAPTASSFTDPALNSDTTYTFNLSVTNAYGQGATAAAPLSILTYPATVTLAPVTLTASGNHLLSWSPGSLPSDVTLYNIYRGEDTGAVTLSATVTATGLTFPVTLTPFVDLGHYYIYQVAAKNPTGVGALSNPQTIFIGPSAPQSVTAVSGLSAVLTENSLNWASVQNEQVASYKVYRATTNTLVSYSSVASGLTTVGFLDNSGLTGNTLYYYLVTAVDINGTESPLDTANAVAVTAYALPNSPVGVNAFPGNASVTLTWTSPSVSTYPIAGYDLYRSTSAGVTGIQVGPLIAGNAVTDTGLTDGVTYYYSLQTQDSLGHLSAFAPQTFAQPIAPPSPPVNTGAWPGDEAAELTWSAATPGTLPIGSYIVFRQSSGPSSPVTQLPASATGFVDTGLTNGVTYTYTIQTVDSSGITTGVDVSSLTAPLIAVPGTGLVNPPSKISVTTGVGSASVSWTDSFTGLGAPVTGYQIYRATAAAGTYSVVATPSTGVGNYADPSVANGTTYYYYFVALNNLGSKSPNSVTVFGTPARAPSAPSTLTETDGATSATLGWNAVAPTDNVPVTDYVISRTPAFGTPVTIFSPGVSFVDSGLTAGTTYIYNWTSYNANSTPSTLSAPVSAFPYNLGQPVLSSNSSPTGVTLTWTPPASSYPVSIYNVYRSTSVTFGAPLTVLTSASVSFLDTSGIFGQLYNYEIQAIDIHNHLGMPSSLVMDGTSNPPPAPSPVLALAGNTQIVVDWAPVKAPIGGLPVSFYIVNRSDGASVTLPATQTWYLDSPVVNGTPVTYTVQTLDASGETTGAHLSAASVTVTTQGSALVINPPNSVAATATGPSTIVLTWTPSNDLGRGVASYEVFRGTSFSALSPVTTLSNPLTAAAITSFTDTGLTYNTTYFYVVQAIDGTGIHSPNSNHGIATTTTPSVIPPPPLVTHQMVFDANLVRPLLGQTLNISYLVPNSGAIEIRIYNITGNLIRTLDPAPAVADVQENTSWDIKDKNGNFVASGIYLIEIRANGFRQMKKVAVVK